jgi:hypothetical protein
MKKQKDLIDRNKVMKILNKYINGDYYKNMTKPMTEFYENMIDDKGVKRTILSVSNGSVHGAILEAINKIENLKNETISN